MVQHWMGCVTFSETCWTTWIDDQTSPRLSNIGQVTINMYSENDVRLSLSRLWMTDAAQDFCADPGSQRLTYETETQSTHPQVHLFRRFEIVRLILYPVDYITQLCDSFLRFTSRRPRLTVYTAMFDVLPFPDTAEAEALAPADLMTLSAPPATSNATATPTSSSNASPAETTIYAAPLPKGERPGVANTNGDYASRRMDVEKLKFRIVFVLWPALIGISMSL